MMFLDPESLIRNTHWWELGGHPTPSLTEAWRQVHHALQPAAELVKAFAIPIEDPSQYTFEWVDGNRIIDGYFMGRLIETPRGVVRAALRPFDMALFLIDPDGRIYAELNLAEKTIEQIHGWVLTTTMNLFDIPVRQATTPPEDLPDHPLAHGDPLGEPHQLALIELVRLYANTASLGRALAADMGDQEPARCWPDPFTLIQVINTASSNADAPPIRIGLSPPDSIGPDGYWFVAADGNAGSLRQSGSAALLHGRWLDPADRLHQRDMMAVLDISSLHGIEEQHEQHALVMRFVADAVNACKASLDQR